MGGGRRSQRSLIMHYQFLNTTKRRQCTLGARSCCFALHKLSNRILARSTKTSLPVSCRIAIFMTQQNFSKKLLKSSNSSCGQIFCADCSEFWAPLPGENLLSPVRLCGPCYHSVTTRMQQVSRLQKIYMLTNLCYGL